MTLRHQHRVFCHQSGPRCRNYQPKEQSFRACRARAPRVSASSTQRVKQSRQRLPLPRATHRGSLWTPSPTHLTRERAMSPSERTFIPVRFAVLTVSDTRTMEEDKSGSLLAARITEAGHELVDRQIARDDVQEIRNVVSTWCEDPDIDAVITTGGTGFTGRDITPEALEPLFDKRMDGFSIVFHRLSFDKIGTSTVQSR